MVILSESPSMVILSEAKDLLIKRMVREGP
jgi:hypothetical protein